MANEFILFPDDINDPVCSACIYKQAGEKCPAVQRPCTIDVFRDCINDNMRPRRMSIGEEARLWQSIVKGVPFKSDKELFPSQPSA